MEPLITPSYLAAFPGAPFDPVLVDVAGEQIRGEAGWHIAPEITETVTVEARRGGLLVLPSLRVVEILEVRDVSWSTPITMTGWALTRGGLTMPIGWPTGTYEVDLVHGFESCPLDLYPAIVSRVRTAANPRDGLASRTITRGPFTDSESYSNNTGTGGVDPAVARYSVKVGVG